MSTIIQHSSGDRHRRDRRRNEWTVGYLVELLEHQHRLIRAEQVVPPSHKAHMASDALRRKCR